jgi:hypothetical protein
VFSLIVACGRLGVMGAIGVCCGSGDFDGLGNSVCVDWF